MGRNTLAADQLESDMEVEEIEPEEQEDVTRYVNGEKVNIKGDSIMSDVRRATDKILEMVEEGILDRDTVIMSCLKYMSEDDVADMAQMNEFFPMPE